MDRVTDQLERSELGRMVLDGLLRDVVDHRRALFEHLEATMHKETDGSSQSEEKPKETAPQVTLEATPQAAPATTTEVS